jgi:hypothetical protein
MRAQPLERGAGALAQAGGFGHELPDHAHAVRVIRERLAEQIRRERRVAERGEHPHPIALVTAEAGAAVENQNTTANVNAGGGRENSGEHPAAGLVLDPFEHAHILGWSSADLIITIFVEKSMTSTGALEHALVPGHRGHAIVIAGWMAS